MREVLPPQIACGPVELGGRDAEVRAALGFQSGPLPHVDLKRVNVQIMWRPYCRSGGHIGIGITQWKLRNASRPESSMASGLEYPQRIQVAGK